MMRGRALDVGFGTGLTLPHYPSEVEVVGLDAGRRLQPDRGTRTYGRLTGHCSPNISSGMIASNMRTLSTQVRLRRLIRAFGEAVERMRSEPAEVRLASAAVARLRELAAGLREAWNREAAQNPPEAAVERFAEQALRTAELAIAGLDQRGADLGLLERDFEDVALPLELILRGLDAQPALQRSA
jgi:hypothetical protein